MFRIARGQKCIPRRFGSEFLAPDPRLLRSFFHEDDFQFSGKKKQKESKKTIDVGFRVVRSLFVMCSLLWIGTIVTQEKFGRRRLCVFFRSQIYVSFRLFLSCRKRPTREARAAVTDETAVAEVVETEETVAAEGAEVVVEEDQAEDPEAVALRNHRASMSKTRAPSPLSKQNCIVCIPLI